MFLGKVPELEAAMLEAGQDIHTKGLPFIRTLEAFSKVVESCFSTQLNRDYETSIEEFRHHYLQLNISITPKVKW